MCMCWYRVVVCLCSRLMCIFGVCVVGLCVIGGHVCVCVFVFVRTPWIVAVDAAHCFSVFL